MGSEPSIITWGLTWLDPQAMLFSVVIYALVAAALLSILWRVMRKS